MKVNIEIKNVGPLPIAYVAKKGNELMSIKELTTKDHVTCDAIHIGFTPQKQLLVHCVTFDLVFNQTSDLEITFV